MSKKRAKRKKTSVYPWAGDPTAEEEYRQTGTGKKKEVSNPSRKKRGLWNRANENN